ncbi:GNAT family N-acetyltransferase [candidate division KSB1 bacterium]|nr:GNAT family N-acetyltransferase [candidate division KSB1 bacterium]
MVRVVDGSRAEWVGVVRELFVEYARWIGIDLEFQQFAAELAALPGDYSPPGGRLNLALADDEVAGCIALREFAPRICEMKRLYVRDAFRGQGIGRTLVLGLIEEARSIGYTGMRLDTLPMMGAAINLYRALGFREIDPYRFNPVTGALYMELNL